MEKEEGVGRQARRKCCWSCRSVLQSIWVAQHHQSTSHRQPKRVKTWRTQSGLTSSFEPEKLERLGSCFAVCYGRYENQCHPGQFVGSPAGGGVTEELGGGLDNSGGGGVEAPAQQTLVVLPSALQNLQPHPAIGLPTVYSFTCVPSGASGGKADCLFLTTDGM